jgi:hypothetical protein
MKKQKDPNTDPAKYRIDNPEVKNKLEAAKKKKYGENTNNFSAGNDKPADFPLLERDARGVVNGVRLPNGDRFDNIDSEAAQKIVDNWNNNNAEPANSMYADVYEKKQMESQQAADSAAQGAKLASTLDTLPENAKFPNATEQAKVELAESQDPTSNAIKNKIIQRYPNNAIENAGQYGLGQLLTLSTNIPVVGKNYKAAIESNANLRTLMQDYSMEDDFKTVQTSIQSAKSIISDSITTARRPGSGIEAANNFRNARLRLLVAERQLSQIADNDQRAYTEDVKRELIDLRSYLDEQLINDQVQMQAALQNPDPNWYKQNNGVVNNGG